MPLLSGAWLLQVAQLRPGTKIQWYVYMPSSFFLCSIPPAWFLYFCSCLSRLAELLIQKEPGNLQAQSLGTLIDKGLARGMSFLPGPPVMSPSGELTSTQRVTSAWRLLVVRPQ